MLCYVMLCSSCTYGAICITQMEIKHKLPMALGSAIQKFSVRASTRTAVLAVTSLCTQQSRALTDTNSVFCLPSRIGCPHRPYCEMQRACGT